MELADQERWAAEQELQVSHFIQSLQEHLFVEPTLRLSLTSSNCCAGVQSPHGLSYEDSNASFNSNFPGAQRTHSNFSAVSRATSTLISRTHSTFLQGHKKFSLKRRGLWERVGCGLVHVTAILCVFANQISKQTGAAASLQSCIRQPCLSACIRNKTCSSTATQYILCQHRFSYQGCLFEAPIYVSSVPCMRMMPSNHSTALPALTLAV